MLLEASMALEQGRLRPQITRKRPCHSRKSASRKSGSRSPPVDHSQLPSDEIREMFRDFAAWVS